MEDYYRADSEQIGTLTEAEKTHVSVRTMPDYIMTFRRTKLTTSRFHIFISSWSISSFYPVRYFIPTAGLRGSS
jgi:hypothetical protein